MNISTMAALKRHMQVGVAVEMTRHDGGCDLIGGKLVRTPEGQVPVKLRGVRTVEQVRSKDIQFSGGSWLTWPPASHVRFTDNGFEVALDDDGDFSKGVMQYEYR